MIYLNSIFRKELFLFLNERIYNQILINYFLLRNDWTKATHMRAIDIWVVLCYIGTFSALMEYCLILYLIKTSKQNNNTRQNDLIQDEEFQELNNRSPGYGVSISILSKISLNALQNQTKLNARPNSSRS